MKKLERADRMRLMKFVCSFVWADLQVKDAERAFVKKMVKKLHLDPAEAKEVDGWLELPPSPDEVDPTQIPSAHRKLFVDTMREVIAVDGEIDPEEKENLELFEQLVR
jgi:uncharacterized tellurite resistance protein B-like protein